MQRPVAIPLVLLTIGALAAACSRPSRELRVLTWSDYVKPAVVERFERQEHCRVVIATFDANEAMLASLEAGAGPYDVIVPSSYMVKIMNQRGLLRALDHGLLPNLAHVDRDVLALAVDRDMHHSVPYMLGVTGIAYRKSQVGEAPTSWAVFDRSDLAGRMTMLDDRRETLGAALKYLGHSLNSTDESELAAARDQVIRWRRNLTGLENESYKPGLQSGELVVAHAYSGDILQLQVDNDDIGFVVPDEGTSFACDDLVIPIDAPDPELAHRFIDYLHDPAVAAENTGFIGFLCPNRPSYDLIPVESRVSRALFPSLTVRHRSEVIADLGEDNARYERMWAEVQAAP